MIDRITLKFGSNPGQPFLNLVLTPITVFVGPNNSGKSKILIELENYCKTTRSQSNQVVLNNLTFTPWDKETFELELQKIEQKPKPNEALPPNYIKIGRVNPLHNQPITAMLQKDVAIAEAVNPNGNPQGQYGQFLTVYTMRLDGTSRLNLCNPQPAGDLQSLSQNQLSHIFNDNIIRAEIRRIIYEAFGKYFVVDPTNIGHLRVRLSEITPPDERTEKGWEKASVDFHSKALEISYASDGVKAFTGIITTLLAGNPKITLIDEPEAFLHPALSAKLGKEIGNSLRNSNRRLFVATHSSNFLMGCIQSGIPLNIVRLTYKNNIPTSRLLDQTKILKLMRHPLLRSTGVLNGLFYEAVVVTESDSDRAFYQEINERLLNTSDTRGVPNCLFLNAQNKQTVWEIVKPLRELGIPTVAIVDIDYVKDGGQVFTKTLDSTFIPQLSHHSLHSQRQAILAALNGTGKDMKRDGGLLTLDRPGQEATNNFFDLLEEYGAFVIRTGELEFWLKHLGASGHGSNWLIDIFDKMGDNPDLAAYVRPTEGDVWDFIGKIKNWVENQKRKGIPE
jgi:ABC-type cobalamin/Fe3+-siderophores transport system ATPase subunit